MIQFIRTNTKKLKSELNKNPFIYATLAILLLIALYFRVYRTHKILGFYFDQGRDAMVIWNLIHNGKFFLIGPTTGIAGIFRGPFYYYLITPFYWLGGGNPVYPAVFLAFTTLLASAISFYLVKKASNPAGALTSVAIFTFSLNLMLASRWLSNPTPMLILSTLLVLSLYAVTLLDKNQKNTFLSPLNLSWAATAFLAGSSLFHFGSAGELFYLPAILIFAAWQRKKISLKTLAISALAFLSTAAPQVIFDLRHEGILRNNIYEFLFQKESFKASFSEILQKRLNFYFDVFTSKLFIGAGRYEKIILTISAIYFLLNIKNFLKHDINKILLLLWISPMLGLLFFQGNEGNIYDYYLTGYYLIFVMIFSVNLGFISKSLVGKAFLTFFIIVLIQNNLELIASRINDKVDGPNTIALGNQLEALDWVYEDAQGKQFNVDVYVPPVIPHAYDYLFTWYGKDKTGPLDQHVDLLYTLYEVDPPHPERLSAWLKRQAGIGEVQYEQKFGGITVQRRTRI